MQYNQKQSYIQTVNTMSSNTNNYDSRTNTRDSRDDRRRGPRHNNEERYIPRDARDDRRDDRRAPRHNNEERYIPRDGDDRRDNRRDAYYESFREEYGEQVARRIYGEDTDPITQPSICIPRTFPTIRGEQTKRAVFRTFRELGIGFIDRIDTVHKTDKNGERFCTVYIHLRNWNVRSQLARDTRQKLLDGEEIKVVYDEPWFWKCTASTIEKPENRYSDGAARTTARPRIDLGEGTRALSRYTTTSATTDDERREEREQHNPEQLCNMDPEEQDE